VAPCTETKEKIWKYNFGRWLSMVGCGRKTTEESRESTSMEAYVKTQNWAHVSRSENNHTLSTKNSVGFLLDGDLDWFDTWNSKANQFQMDGW